MVSSTTIVPQVLIGVGASATLYLYVGNQVVNNLCVVSTVDLTIHVTDGFGRNQTAVQNSETLPYSMDEQPDGTYFSTGGRTYQSKPKVAGASITTICPILSRCGPWIAMTLGNQEASPGVISILGAI